MNRIRKIKFLSVGFLAGAIFFGGISYAATAATKIDVFFQPLKYFFDGVEKKAPDSQQGFVYNGTTYVPLRFIAESLGQKVGYQAKDFSVYVGQQPSGQVTKMTEMKTFTASADHVEYVTTFMSNIGENFVNGYVLRNTIYSVDANQWGNLSYEYLLNGQYKKFQAILAPQDSLNNVKKIDNAGNLKVYADDILIYDSGAIASDITKAIKVDLDLTGVLRIKIIAGGSYLGLLDPKFIN